MSTATFLDTNVIVRRYDFAQPPKQTAATDRLRREIETGEPTVSTQVLGEVYQALTRPPKGRRGAMALADHATAAREVKTLSRLRVVTVTREILLTALDMRERHQMGWWDAVHLATAKAHGCTRLLTEDVPGAANRGSGHPPMLEGIVYEDPFVGLA